MTVIGCGNTTGLTIPPYLDISPGSSAKSAAWPHDGYVRAKTAISGGSAGAMMAIAGDDGISASRYTTVAESI